IEIGCVGIVAQQVSEAPFGQPKKLLVLPQRIVSIEGDGGDGHGAGLSQSTPSPLRGGIKGGGCLAQTFGLAHPHPSFAKAFGRAALPSPQGGGWARYARLEAPLAGF